MRNPERYFVVAYMVLGAALTVAIATDRLPQGVGLVGVAFYVVGFFLLARILGRPLPFGWSAPDAQGRLALSKDLLWFAACVVGAFGVAMVGVLISPTSETGVLLVAVPSVLLILFGGVFVARALSRVLRFRLPRQ
jgi:hypothetical protein